MIRDFAKCWNKNKDKLSESIKTNQKYGCFDYVDLVKLLFDNVIDIGVGYNTDEITVIDDGDYQGTQIFVLHERGYQPNVDDYIYTNTYYGSCSGCDTLLSIQEDGLTDEEELKDYMTLCLHLLQQCKRMFECNDKEQEMKSIE